MATGRLKVWNERVGAWDYVAPGEIGATGPTGPEGPIGSTGATGPMPSYSEISTAEIDSGSSSTGRLISGRRIGHLRASSMGTVVHGTNASAARPNNFTSVTWIGTVQPINAIANDIWYNG